MKDRKHLAKWKADVIGREHIMLIMNSKGQIISRRSREVDFVFVYEVKNRELQGIALIGYELLRRGYSVAYINTWHELDRVNNHKYKAKVAVVFEAYNTAVTNFALSFIDSCDSVVNMQWEQMLNDDCLKQGSIYVLNGKANDVYHLSWGNKNVEHLIEYCGLPNDKVKLVGHVGLDFVRPELDGFYKGREEILEEYNIPQDKKILLFLSSFASLDIMSSDATADKEFFELQRKSQEEIINWIKKYCSQHQETVFVYRPHPTEQISTELKDMCGDSVKIIKDYSVQQWIKISDCILNWWSTSLADIYASKRTCLILRPYEMIKKHEYHCFETADKVKTYEEFEEKIDYLQNFPIKKEIFEQYYFFDEKEPAYLKIAKELEKIYKLEDKLPEAFFHAQKECDVRFIRNLRVLYGYYKVKWLYLMEKKELKDDYNELHYHRLMDKQNYTSDRQIIRLMNRIGKVLGS